MNLADILVLMIYCGGVVGWGFTAAKDPQSRINPISTLVAVILLAPLWPLFFGFWIILWADNQEAKRGLL